MGVIGFDKRMLMFFNGYRQPFNGNKLSGDGFMIDPLILLFKDLSEFEEGKQVHTENQQFVFRKRGAERHSWGLAPRQMFLCETDVGF